MVDARENNSCADVAADAVSYYSCRFESCSDYKKLKNKKYDWDSIVYIIEYMGDNNGRKHFFKKKR